VTLTPGKFLGPCVLGFWLAGLGLGCDPAPAPAAEIHWASNFEAAMQEARAEQKFVMIDFYTTWCYWCKVLDTRTYADDKVAAGAGGLVCVKVNAEAEQKLAATYGVSAYPTVVFLNPDETLRQKIRGFQPPEGFLSILHDVLRTETEQFALSMQTLSSPRDKKLRQSLAQTLAMAGKFREAAAQCDTLLLLNPSDDERSGAELDRWIFLHRAGEGKEAREGLERWVKKARKHPRLLEGQYFLAQAEEREGRRKQARKAYEQILKAGAGSWFAEVARAKITNG
jgi:thioredoxin-like negative regulator of GroEL